MWWPQWIVVPIKGTRMCPMMGASLQPNSKDKSVYKSYNVYWRITSLNWPLLLRRCWRRVGSPSDRQIWIFQLFVRGLTLSTSPPFTFQISVLEGVPVIMFAHGVDGSFMYPEVAKQSATPGMTQTQVHLRYRHPKPANNYVVYTTYVSTSHHSVSALHYRDQEARLSGVNVILSHWRLTSHRTCK